MKNSAAIDAAMQKGIADGVFPAAELLVGTPDKILYHNRFGRCTPDSIFDIASLTKPICTATLAMMAAAEGKLAVTDLLRRRISEAQDPSHDTIQLQHLLRHTSGLPAHRPYYLQMPTTDIGTPSGKKWIITACSQEKTIYPAGDRKLYSDIGFILLGQVVEEALGAPLDQLFSTRVARPLGLAKTAFTGGTLPTQHCPWRQREIVGENRDENCHAMGGVAGHSGLFSSAEDLHQFATAFVTTHDGTTPVLGWDVPEGPQSAAGTRFSSHTIGHLAFTGCSLWIDLQRKLWVILLTNRTYPTIENNKIRDFRPMIHDVILAHFSS